MHSSKPDNSGSSSGNGGSEEQAGKIILHAQYPYIYIWDSGSQFDTTQSEMDAEDNGWYRFEIESSSAMVIFKPNADDWNGQTDGLHATTGEWWYDDGSLHYYKPDGGDSSGGSSDENNESSDNNSGSGEQTDTQLSAPTGLIATTQSSSEIILSWNAVSDATLYDVYYGTNSSSASANLYTYSISTRCTVSSLSANTLYYFWVKACASDGTESDFSSSANARTNASSSESGETTTTNNTATIYFVGSSSAISATGFNNIYVGNYQFGDLFISVKTSKTLSNGTVDGPYQIKTGTYLLKFGNPATGNVYNSTLVRKTAHTDRNGRLTGYSLSTYNLSDYKFEFEEGKVYTISKISGIVSAKSRTGSTIHATHHNITAKEGTD